jgi:hypothetical protein
MQKILIIIFSFVFFKAYLITSILIELTFGITCAVLSALNFSKLDSLIKQLKLKLTA